MPLNINSLRDHISIQVGEIKIPLAQNEFFERALPFNNNSKPSGILKTTPFVMQSPVPYHGAGALVFKAPGKAGRGDSECQRSLKGHNGTTGQLSEAWLWKADHTFLKGKEGS